MHKNQSKHSKDCPEHLSAEEYLVLACSRLTALGNVIKIHGAISIAEYVRQVTKGPFPKPFQPRTDLYNALFSHTKSLLGNQSAGNLVSDIESNPVLITTNHHGIDFFSHSIQGSLLYASGNPSVKTVPILSCASVPLNNATYPKGLLLYDVSEGSIESMPVKLPVFPKKFNLQLVVASPRFDRSMIKTAGNKLRALSLNNTVSDRMKAHVETLFKEVYLAENLLSENLYASQSVIANSRIWKQLFSPSSSVPEIIYLDQETIVSKLLESDLNNGNSLAARIMFDAEVCHHLLSELDTEKGCWHLEILKKRVTNKTSPKDTAGHEPLKKSGTVFFWGINRKNKRIPFYLDISGNPKTLHGRDESGNTYQIEFTPSSLTSAIRKKKLVPSNFTCFLELAFARGMTCLGGYFQSEYLPRIKKGLIKVLSQHKPLVHASEAVSTVPCDRYLSGMVGVMIKHGHGSLIPAGTVEISGKPITPEDMTRLKTITVRDAHLAGLFETIPDIIPATHLPPGWKGLLARELYGLLKEKVLIK